MLAPLPDDEEARLAVLEDLAIMDTPAEERFDRITRIVSQVFDVPIALVGLIDADRQWYKSCIGLDGSEAARGDTFCQYAILGETTLVVPDARDDPRFRDKPAVTGPPNIRFYAGRPLVVRGRRLGTLCIIDVRARQFSEADDQMLRDLAGWVEHELNVLEVERTAAELAHSQAYLASLLESVPDGVATFDAAGTILSFNAAACRMFGRTEAEAVGTSILSLVSVPDQSAVIDRLAQRLAGQIERVRVEVEAVRADGTTFPMEIVVGDLQADGQPTFVAVGRDLGEINRLKDEFVSVVSHELRTPLTSLRASIGMLASGALGDLSEDAARMVDIAEGNAERLVRLVNDILELQRLQAGRAPLDVTTCSAADLAAATVATVGGAALEAGVALEVDVDDLVVEADPYRMTQVLTNLAANAVKFSAAGATVRLEASASGGVAVFRVVDRGRGIPADHVDTIFRPFEQVDTSDAREKGGSGLGLAIARGIVEQHGGRIGVESVLGEGSTFWVELPLVPAG